MGTRNILHILEGDCRPTFRHLDRLSAALRDLRFEGAYNQKKNIREIGRLTRFFNGEVRRHMRLEERVLFPFIRSHIPRLDPILCLLLSEHQDFRNSLYALRVAVSASGRPGLDKADLVQRIHENGTYLNCLLRSHFWLETQSLYRIVDKELKPTERARLVRQLRQRKT